MQCLICRRSAHRRNEAAADCAHAEAILLEAEEEQHRKVAAGDFEDGGGDSEELSMARMEAKAGKRARRWMSFGDLLSIVGRYLHETIEIEEEVPWMEEVDDTDPISVSASLSSSLFVCIRPRSLLLFIALCSVF